MRNAYAPYSRLPGRRRAARRPTAPCYAGANVENAAYPQGQCAEASAIGALVAAGRARDRRGRRGAPRSSSVCPPCGGCRQRLKEFAQPGHARVPRAPRRPGARTTSASCCRWPSTRSRWRDAPTLIVPRAHGAAARSGIVLGSGPGRGRRRGRGRDRRSPTRTCPASPRPTVHGHAGRAVLGTLAGVPVACSRAARTSTRAATRRDRAAPVRDAARPPAPRSLVLTNAAGSLRARGRSRER